MKDFLKRAISQGRGLEPADLVLKNGSFYDLGLRESHRIRYRHLW